MATLSRTVLTGVDLICNRARFTYLLLFRHFNCAFYEFYPYFHLANSLIVTGWCYSLTLGSFPQNLKNYLNISDVKFMPASEINFFREFKFCEYDFGCFNQDFSCLGNPSSVNMILAVLTRSSAARLSFCFTIENLL